MFLQNLNVRARDETRDLQFFKQAALATAPGHTRNYLTSSRKCKVEAVYMYFSGTGIRGGENIIMIHWFQNFSIRNKLIKENKKRANFDVTGVALSNYTRTPS